MDCETHESVAGRAAPGRAEGPALNARGELVAVCRLFELRTDEGPVGLTAIDKRPVEGPVRVRTYGVHADLQASRQHHGGLDKAVYAYGQEDADWWASELGREIPPGLFGENLRIRGLEVGRAEIGEQWTVGGTTLEVTEPRTPCATFARRMGEGSDWIRRFTEANRTGCYLRVLCAGDVEAGDPVAVVRRPGHGVSVSDWFEAYTRRGAEPEAFAELARRLLAAEDDGAVRLADDIHEHGRAALAPR